MSGRREQRLSDTIEVMAGPLARLRRSLREDEHILEQLAEALAELNGDVALRIDAFLQRFQQTCDIALRKLLPRLLAVLEQTDVRHSFVAVLDRLEGLGVIDETGWWFELNELRNRLTHEYAMGADVRVAELRQAWKIANRLVTELDRIRSLPLPRASHD